MLCEHALPPSKEPKGCLREPFWVRYFLLFISTVWITMNKMQHFVFKLMTHLLILIVYLAASTPNDAVHSLQSDFISLNTLKRDFKADKTKRDDL